MAYKDEYEVARLYSDGEFAKVLKEQFDGDPGVKVSLAPPLLAAPRQGDRAFAQARIRPLELPGVRAAGSCSRSLGGTALDFRLHRRTRMERALPGEYFAMIFRHLDKAKSHDCRGWSRWQNQRNTCAATAISRKPTSQNSAESARLDVCTGEPVGMARRIGNGSGSWSL